MSLAEAAANVVVWDTGSALKKDDNIEAHTNWKLVPRDLFSLEKDPAKASSDPGYYGRRYSFKGDAVVENEKLLASFSSADGRLVLYAKPIGAQGTAGAPLKIAEVFPLSGNPSAGAHLEIVRNGGDEVEIQNSNDSESTEVSATFSFDKTEIVGIKPSDKVGGMRISAPVAYSIVPGFIGDDLIWNSTVPGDSGVIAMPNENIFLGLLQGESSTLVMTWPKGNQKVRVRSAKPDASAAMGEIEFENDRQPFFLAAQRAPGLWHKEDLNASFLEKDIPVRWKRPFPARWQTSLLESGIKTRFHFSEFKREIWRGVPGSYSFPVWFDGDTPFYHLSKKIPPKGESLIYFTEGEDTPGFVSSPAEVLKATVGRPVSSQILDAAGRQLRTHHRRGASGVRRACTCGCTEVIQAYFEDAQETAKKAEIAEALADMTYFVERHVARIGEYQKGAADLIQFLGSPENSRTETKPFAEKLAQTAQQIIDEYNVQRENMKSAEYAAELVRKTMALTDRTDKQNLAAYMNLLKDWRAMGGAQDYVVAQCHSITRKLSQEAGYGCGDQPANVKLAEEVRRRCRAILRNPDGYEIWSNY